MKKKSPWELAATTRFPSPLSASVSALTPEEKVEKIAQHFQAIMETLGLDLKDDSLQKTPLRVAKMYVHEIFSGLDKEQFPPITFIENKRDPEAEASLILVKVRFTSFCEHHFVPMSGWAHVAYLPQQKLIGLSKIPRIVRFFARRPQIQERLSAQIADCLALLLDTEDVAVSLIAHHYCVVARGVEDENGHTITNVLRGEFQTNPLRRKEFFEGVNRAFAS